MTFRDLLAMNPIKSTPVIAAMATSLCVSVVAIATTDTPYPTAKVVDNGKTLEINYAGKTQNIKASSLNVGILVQVSANKPSIR